MHPKEGSTLFQAQHDSVVTPELPQHIEAQIQGEISGQVTVGSHIVQLGSVHGGVVNINSVETAMPKPRPLPVLLRPRPFLNLIGREQEVKTVMDVLKSAIPTEICGPEGIGKTSMLRYLCHRPEFSLLFPDGIVYLSARSKPVSDILQSLYDAFYDYGATIKPTEAQITLDLQDKRALIVLDDVKLPRDDLEDLMDVVSGSTFLVSSQEQLLWSEGESIALQGLPMQPAIALVENKLGWSLTPAERTAAEQLCQSLHGHPLRLLQSLGQVKQHLQSWEEVVRQAASEVGDRPDYSEPERQVLAVLSTVGAAGLQAQQVAAITALPEAENVLQSLHQRTIVQLEDDRYSIKDREAALLSCDWNLRPFFQKVLAYFIQFAEAHKADPGQILQESDALLKLLNQAAEVGLWAEVLSLGQLIENAFAVKKQWGVWETVLQIGLQAARETGQRAAEALMLHQIGTRAVCLGEQEMARHALTQAIEIRDATGDRIGAAISRHNLQMLFFIVATATTAAAAAVALSAGSASAGVGSATMGAAGTAATAGAVGGTGAGTVAATAAGTTAGLSLTNLLIGGAGVAAVVTGTIVGVEVIRNQPSPNRSAPPVKPGLALESTATPSTASGIPAIEPEPETDTEIEAEGDMGDEEESAPDSDITDKPLPKPVETVSPPRVVTRGPRRTVLRPQPSTRQIAQTPLGPTVTPEMPEGDEPGSSSATDSLDRRPSASEEPEISLSEITAVSLNPDQQNPGTSSPEVPQQATVPSASANEQDNAPGIFGTPFNSLHDARIYYREQRGE